MDLQNSSAGLSWAVCLVLAGFTLLGGWSIIMVSAGIMSSVLCILSSNPTVWAHSHGNYGSLLPRLGTHILSVLPHSIGQTPDSRDREIVFHLHEEVESKTDSQNNPNSSPLLCLHSFYFQNDGQNLVYLSHSLQGSSILLDIVSNYR